MNILLLAPHPFYQNRGTPIAVKLLTEVLAENGHQLDILTYHEGMDVDIPNVSVHRIPKIPGVNNIMPGPSWKKIICDVVLFAKCLLMLTQKRYDIIHAVEELAFMAAFIKIFFRIPYIYDMDSSIAQQIVEKYKKFRRIKFILELFERAAIRKSFGVVAVCKYLENIVRECDPHKTLVRLEDISLLQESPQTGELLKEDLEISGSIIMYVGNLEKYQGIDLLLESFQVVAAKIADVHLVIIGGTATDIKTYQGISRQLGIDRKTHFIGPKPISQLESFLVQADILVSPRIQGGNTPMKIYSYLDSGKPVLATRLPTHTQVLDDRIAVLVQPDPDSMAVGLLSLIGDLDYANSLALNAKKKVADEFSYAAFKKKLLGFYSLIQKKKFVGPSI